MANWQSYLDARNVVEASENRQGARRLVQAIGEGGDWLLESESRGAPAQQVLAGPPDSAEWRQIQTNAGAVYVGAGVTHFELLHDPHLAYHARCLAEASGLTGGPQMAGAETIGGRISRGLPADAEMLALLALDAQAEFDGPLGRRRMPVEHLQTPGQLVAVGQERLLRFRLPLLGPREASAFHRMVQRQGLGVAVLNMAVWLRSGPDGSVADIRLAVAPADVRPFRARRTEDFLRGRILDEETIVQAASELRRETQLRAGPRVTSDFRRLVLPLLERVLETAHYRVMAA